MRCVSGEDWMMPLAMFLRTVVFPAFGGETTMPRWPLPTGAIMSTMRPVTSVGPVSRRNRSLGKSGVSLSNPGRFFAASGSPSFTFSTDSSAAYFSFSRATRILPVTVSPLRRLCRRT